MLLIQGVPDEELKTNTNSGMNKTIVIFVVMFILSIICGVGVLGLLFFIGYIIWLVSLKVKSKPVMNSEIRVYDSHVEGKTGDHVNVNFPIQSISSVSTTDSLKAVVITTGGTSHSFMYLKNYKVVYNTLVYLANKTAGKT